MSLQSCASTSSAGNLPATPVSQQPLQAAVLGVFRRQRAPTARVRLRRATEDRHRGAHLGVHGQPGRGQPEDVGPGGGHHSIHHTLLFRDPVHGLQAPFEGQAHALHRPDSHEMPGPAEGGGEGRGGRPGEVLSVHQNGESPRAGRTSTRPASPSSKRPGRSTRWSSRASG